MSLPFTHDDLMLAVLTGEVTQRKHPTLPLYIYNYSPEIQYSNKWSDVTLNCRGLILDNLGKVVARPWRKFFNLGQVDLPIQFDTPVEIMDKADGSLGILYPDGEGGFAVATRGSFESTQAIKATEIWKEKYATVPGMDMMMRVSGMTYLFEIIIPWNRIVLNYEDMEDLILLGAVENSTGYYYGPQQAAAFCDWTGPVVEVMPFNTLSDALGNMDRKNAEGFVIRSHNFLVKCKQPDYLELHRLVTNASPKTVWEQLKIGKSRAEIVSAFPDEFHEYIGSMIDPLLEQFVNRREEIMKGFDKSLHDFMARGEDYNRGGYARYIKKHPDRKYFFLLLDTRPIRDVLWQELRPRESDLT